MRPIVLANGCFDVLHFGHIQHLREAARLGNYLIVSLTLDEYVNKGPGRPIHKWDERAEQLRELRCVNLVSPSPGMAAAILEHKPDIVVKGVDYKRYDFEPEVKEALEKTGAKLVITTSNKRSSTGILVKQGRDVRMQDVFYERTKDAVPPADIVVAVLHKFANMAGGIVDDEACFDGERWLSKRTGEWYPKNHFQNWRRID